MKTVLEMWNISEHFLVKRSLLKDMEDIMVNFKFYFPDDLLFKFFPNLSKKSMYSDSVYVSDCPPRTLESGELIPKDFDKRRSLIRLNKRPIQ
jgi:hypothetical protein